MVLMNYSARTVAEFYLGAASSAVGAMAVVPEPDEAAVAVVLSVFERIGGCLEGYGGSKVTPITKFSADGVDDKYAIR
jgi:hypothetical protein